MNEFLFAIGLHSISPTFKFWRHCTGDSKRDGARALADSEVSAAATPYIVVSSFSAEFVIQKMKFQKNLLIFICLLIAVSAQSKESKPKKLQIGIKKRVENCSMKSKRGDLLHMHYTVWEIVLFSYSVK
jgi:hypothetical protein